ncbi:MAG TPA: hypothetical protein VJL59_05210 [Anaerolineales bacterium]|nr:hypothetical protein [Anaerolineales bacterium]
MPDEQDKKNALAFLRLLEMDDDLAARCDADDDPERIMAIAAEAGLPFSGYEIYRGTCARRAWKIAPLPPKKQTG